MFKKYNNYYFVISIYNLLKKDIVQIVTNNIIETINFNYINYFYLKKLNLVINYK